MVIHLLEQQNCRGRQRQAPFDTKVRRTEGDDDKKDRNDGYNAEEDFDYHSSILFGLGLVFNSGPAFRPHNLNDEQPVP